jgi:hypothetical protein
MKREIPLAITFISGFLLVVALFIPHKPFGVLEEVFNDWYIIVAGFTMILGIDSLLLSHWNKIKRRRPGWIHSIALILSFFITLIWGFYSGIKTGHFLSSKSTFRQYFYIYIFVPLQATMFALLAFFIASAAYRAFRARTVDATLLLTSAAIVMLGRVPRGELAAPPLIGAVFVLLAIHFFLEGRKETTHLKKALYYAGTVVSLAIIYPLGKLLYLYLPSIADWTMNVPQTAAKRGIFIGISLGGIAIALRIILGIERSYLK